MVPTSALGLKPEFLVPRLMINLILNRKSRPRNIFPYYSYDIQKIKKTSTCDFGKIFVF